MALRSDVRSGAPPQDAWTADPPPEIDEIDATLALEQFAGTEAAGSESETVLLTDADVPVRVADNPNHAPQRGEPRQGYRGRPLKVAIAALLVAAAAATAFVTVPGLSVRPQAVVPPAEGVLVLQSSRRCSAFR
jgi:hypothetical protein